MMIKAVLLDLDDTLLYNPNQGFIPHYLQLIDTFFDELWGVTVSDTLVKTVQSLMNAPRDMQHTNQQVLLDALHTATQQPPDLIFEVLQDFYRRVYPALCQHTRPIPFAQTLVQRLHTDGYQVVIATNPIYPAEAIRQRLTWAGLSSNFDDYAFVTHAGNMHFAKPAPAYYAEILGRVGIEADEAIMIGDSVTNDIIPAAQIGMLTYHVENGDLQAALASVTNADQHPAPIIDHTAVIPMLQGNIGALFGLIANIKPHFWTQQPDPNEWSPLQILHHLIASEAKYMRHFNDMRAVTNAFLYDNLMPPEPPNDLSAGTGEALAQQFLQERQKTIDFLNGLTPSDWQRTARHSVFGRTILLEMARFIAQHDRLHLKQLCRTIGKCE